MREIKYKAYHKKKELLVDVLSINFEHNTVTLAIETDSDEEYYWWSGTCHLEDVELMQYTGLTDKNGKEIYERDIVKLTVPDRHYTMQGNGYSDIMREDGFEFVGEVKFLHAMWFIKESLDGYPLIFDTNQTLEVIGNIYQHKHLLKENEK